MKNNDGVTILSLSIYIIVSVVILGTLAFLNINFMSQISDLTVKSEKSSEILKVQSYIIDDLKSANRVLEFSEKHLRLDNGVEYLVKYRANEKKSEQTFDVYELYRNNILITDKMSNVEFNFENLNNQEIVMVKLNYIKDEEIYGGQYFFKVGRGY